MTTPTHTRTAPLIGATALPPRNTAVSLSRLSAVELRKATDTRAGRWMLVVTVLAGAALAVIAAFAGERDENDVIDVVQASAFAFALLTPVLGLLLVTSEWSQRTALTTFTLVPRRGRVVAAKAVAAGCIGVGATVLALVFGLLATAAAPHDAGLDVWDLTASVVARVALYEVAYVFFGLGFGLLLLNSTLAIVAYFVLPTVWTVLANSITGLSGVRDWLDPSTTFGHLLEVSTSGQQWAQIGVAALVWVGVPAVIGAVRVRRSSIA